MNVGGRSIVRIVGTGAGKPNLALKAALDAAGLTSYDLARRINAVLGHGFVHRTTPRAWCSAGVTPRPPLPRVVAKIVSEATGQLIKPTDLWPRIADDGGVKGTHEGLADLTPDRVAAALPLELETLSSWADLVCISGGDLLRLTRTWQPPGERRSRLQEATHPDDPVLDHLEKDLSQLRSIDDGVGGAALLTVVAHQQRLLASLAVQYGEGTWQAERCLAVLAQYTQFAGWLALDLGHHARAQRSFFLALRLSELAEDDDLSALIISCLALQAVSRGRPQDARPLAEGATRGRPTSPAATAILWMRRARSSAALGDESDFQVSIERARASLDAQGVVGDRPGWSYWITEEILAAEEGRAWIDLATPARARSSLTRTVVSPTTTGRDRVLYGAALAQAHLADGEIDQACAELQDTAPFLPGTTSRRCRDLLGDVTRDLARHRLTAPHRRAVETVALALSDRPDIQGV